MTVNDPSLGSKSAIRPRGSSVNAVCPLESQLLLDDKISLGESLRGIALLQREIERDVVAEFRMDRDARGQGLLVISDHGQLVPLDHDEIGRVFGLGAARSNHSDHRLALPDRLVLCEQRLRRRSVSRPMQGDAYERPAQRIEIGAGADGGNARSLLRRIDVDRADLGVRTRTSHEADVKHARKGDIVDITAAATHQYRLELAPRDACADPGVLRRGTRGPGHLNLSPLLRCDSVNLSVVASDCSKWQEDFD